MAKQIDESSLTKGQARKLNALRKSLGEEIADRAFLEWLASQPAAAGSAPDDNATLVVGHPLAAGSAGHTFNPARRVSDQARARPDHRRAGKAVADAQVGTFAAASFACGHPHHGDVVSEPVSGVSLKISVANDVRELSGTAARIDLSCKEKRPDAAGFLRCLPGDR